MTQGSHEQRLASGLRTPIGKASSVPLGAPAISTAPRWHISAYWLGSTVLLSPVSCGTDSHWALDTCLQLSCLSVSGWTLLQKEEIALLAGLTSTDVCNVVSKGTARVSSNELNWIDWEKAACWTLMFTVGLLDLPSSGRIVQVRAGSNSPHLDEGLHLPPQFDSYSPLLWEADNNVSAPYPVLLLSHRDATVGVLLLFLGA